MSAFPASEHVGVLITDSPCKNTVMEHDIKQEIIKKERTSLFSDAEHRGSQDDWYESANSNTHTSMTEYVNGNESPNISDLDLSEHYAHDESPIKFKRSRRYINNQVFENVSVHYVKNVPVDFDGTVIYVVPENPSGELKPVKVGGIGVRHKIIN